MCNAQRFVVFTILTVRGCVKYAVAHKGERKCTKRRTGFGLEKEGIRTGYFNQDHRS